MSRRIGLGAVAALAVCATVQASPDLLIDLTAEDFVSVLNDNEMVPAWVNHGSLGSSFRPVGTGVGTVFNASVAGVPAVTLLSSERNNNCVMTNMVPPGAVTGANPWTFETWIYKAQTHAAAEDAFTWTGRNGAWGSAPAGTCWEFRYGTDAANAVERYDGGCNLRWNGLVGGGIPAVGQWHHVVATRDTSGWERLYLDGVMRDCRYPPSFMIRNDVGYFTIGAVRNLNSGGGWDNVFSGSIARLRVYAGALTTREVFTNYLAGCTAFNLTPQPLDQFWDGAPGAWAPWSVPGNWTKGVVPADNDPFYMDNKGKAGSFSGSSVFQNFNAWDGGFGMTGGLMEVSNTVTMANGLNRVFEFRMTGGKFNIPGADNRHLYLGQNGGHGYAYIGGGEGLAWLCVDKDMQAGQGNAGYGYVEVLTNGLVTVSNGWFYINCNSATATGEVVVAGGTIRGERDCRIVVGQGRGAKAKLTVNDGSVEMNNEMRMSGDQAMNAASLAEVFFNGGLIWIQRVNAYTPGQNYWYFNGGTLRNRDNRTDFFQNLTAAYVQAGGAVFDVIAGTSVTVNQALAAPLSGASGGLVKLGAGTLTLGGANTFTGGITVSRGNLLLRNAAGLPSGYSGTILLENGAGIGWEAAGGASTLASRLHPSSVGTILLFGVNAGDAINLSGHPNVTLGFAGQGGETTYNGTHTPAAGGQYRFSAFGDWNNRDVFSPAISGSASVTLEAGSTGFLCLSGNNDFTGGITVNGGVLGANHTSGFGQTAGGRDIGIYNGAALLVNAGVGQAGLDAIVARIKTDSRGALLLNGNVSNCNVDLSLLPGVSLGAENNRDYGANAILTPHAGVGYHLGGGWNAWNNSGLGFRNLTDGEGPRTVVLSYPGSAQLVTNNTFSGGILVTNAAATLWMQNDTALGAVPGSVVPDYLTISRGNLRPNQNVPYAASHPNRGLTVGSGGMAVYTGDRRLWAWQGDLSGSGAITNMDSGVIMFGGANNTWDGTLTLNNNNDNGTFAVGYGQNFSWPRNNIITGTAQGGMFGVATDLDISWTNKFARPLGNAPMSYDTPDGTSANIGLRKLGAGTLTLDTPNTYRRETKVENGILKIGVQNAIPYGSNKGNLNVMNGNVFPKGILDINGFDVNANALFGGGVISNSQDNGKALIVGNNNANGTAFYGTVDPSARIAKTGNGQQTFWKGADVSALTVEQGTVYAGAETVFGNVELKGTSAFYAGLAVGETNGLTGEYYWLDYVETQPLVAPGLIVDLDAFEALLSRYAPTHVQLSTSFGETFDPGDTGTRFQGGYNGRSYHYNRWTGEFYAGEDGLYGFSTASDDGSAVFINRQLVVDNDRNQSYNPADKRYGTVALTKGWHDIVIAYYQMGSGRGLTVFMTPPEGVESALPQALLRPYPLTVNSLSGTPGSRVEFFANASLAVAGEAVNVYSGRLVSATADARFIKNGTADFIFAGQTAPEFKGQVTVNGGDLGLMAASPARSSIDIMGGGKLYAIPEVAEWGNWGLRGTYYNGGNISGGLANTAEVLNRYGPYTPDSMYNTVQGGPDAALGAMPDFYYDAATFPGPYAQVGNPAEYFSTWYKGRFLALEAGDYTFELWCDDRGDLYLNGERICQDAGYQTTQIKTATRYLAPGTHDLQLVHYQGSGGYFIRVRVAPPGDEMMRLPNAWLRPSVSTIYSVKDGTPVDLPCEGSYLCWQAEEPQTFGGSITGPAGAEMEKNGAAILTLVGDNDGFEGGWFVLKGELAVGDGGTAGTLGGHRVYVAAGATLTFNRSDDIIYDGPVSGNGEIRSIGGGRVTFSNFGSDFKGVFTEGDFVVAGASTALLPSSLVPQGGAVTSAVCFADGAVLLIPPDADPDLNAVPLGFANGTVRLPLVDANVHYRIPSLMVAAGTEVRFAAAAPSGLIGRYYALAYDTAIVSAQYLSLETAEAYLQQQTLICEASTWDAGANMDFGENGALFPTVITNRAVNFGAIWKGKINIPATGEYIFKTRSDDQSMLFINGILSVDNNGNHGMQDRFGTNTLSAGLHDFAVVYAQGSSGYGLRVEVAAPGKGSQFLPNSMLIQDTADIAAMPFTLEVGTLGVVDGPGVGTVDMTGGAIAAGDVAVNGMLLLNDLFIESSPGTALAVKGHVAVASGNHLHVELGDEPPPGAFFKIADFQQAGGIELEGKTRSLRTLDGKGKLVYRTGDQSLYISTSAGTVLILR